MNMAYNLYQAQDFDYSNEDQEKKGSAKAGDKARSPQYARRNRPAVHNGIHRRRNKRFAW